MGLFAIGDIHFGFSVNKPMGIFGKDWENHSEKIIENWKREVTAEDTVLLVGDISWAMKEFDAKVDLDFIDGLPGRKILIEGNHDYWWKSASRLEREYNKMRFLKNDCEPYEDIFICGSRGWLCPNDSNFTGQDLKLYQREQIRLRLSLDSAMRKGAQEILLMMHYPPTNDQREHSAFLDIIQEYPIKNVVFGHLHGSWSHKMALQGLHEGTKFQLVSADYVGFCPKRIL